MFFDVRAVRRTVAEVSRRSGAGFRRCGVKITQKIATLRLGKVKGPAEILFVS